MSVVSASASSSAFCFDQVGEPVQHRAAFGVAHPRPRALVERPAGRQDGAVGVSGPAQRHLGVRLPGPRVDRGEPAAG